MNFNRYITEAEFSELAAFIRREGVVRRFARGERLSGQGALFIPGDDFDPVDGTALFVGTAEEKQHGERQQQRQPDGAGRGE